MDKKPIKLVFFIKIILIIIILSLKSYPQNKKPITLVFRYDDFPVNIKLEKHIISIFNEYNLPITFGVIPSGTFNLNDYDIGVLKNTDKKKEVEIALHGFAHTKTELFGTYDEQYKILEKGKKYLEKAFDTKVITFIPPFNRYSFNTIKVLNALNFKVISSTKQGPFDDSKLIFLPQTSKLTSLKKDIEFARKSKLKNCIIVVLLHSYNFYKNKKVTGKINEQEFADLIKWVSRQNDIEVKTIGEAAELINTKNFANYNKVSDISIFRFLPFDQHRFDLISYPLYPSFELLKNIRKNLYIFIITYQFIALAIISLIFYLIFSKFIKKRIRINTILLIVLLLPIGFIIPIRFWGTFIALILGSISGMILSNYKLKDSK